MGLYIPKMKMPKDNCEAIQQITITNNWIDGEIKILAHDSITNEFIGEVVEIPEPHGRLIDANALYSIVDEMEAFDIWVSTASANKFKRAIKAQPTIIEAEGE